MSALVLTAIDDDARTTPDVEVLPPDPSVTSPGGLVVVPPRPDVSFIKSWVRGCTSSGWSAAFCRCAINEYATRLRDDEFETAAVIGRSGGRLAELPDHLREVVQDVERKCR